MFEGLKKRFSNLINKLSDREKEKSQEKEQTEAAPAPGPEKKLQEAAKPKEIPEHPVHYAEARHAEPVAKPAITEKPAHHAEAKHAEHIQQPSATEKTLHEPIPEPSRNEENVAKKAEARVQAHAKPLETKKADVSFTTKIKGFVFGQVKISEKDVEPFMEGLRIDLLESDVNYDVAERITDGIHTALVGKVVNSRDVNSQISDAIKESVKGILVKGSGVNLVSLARSKKSSGDIPFKVLFIGPNGAGKTTTMAKVAKMMSDNGLSCVFSASDTFRAAAIEQTAVHADRLGIRVIKGKYGADPASVAFDAIAHAKAHGVDVVLMDSAGRQETNKSLIEELKKMVRIAKPDMKIFVGESIAGNSLLEQVRVIHEAVTIDGIILTKLDVDAKGGNTLSILGDTTVPILFFGTGERYEDLVAYDPDFVIGNLFGNN
ncbi:MAG: signal recognition particle-docking protein FtsY [Candidatus Micrarchaeota archaeon]|nr:signal recognition particle-docking protein FtsY [Candidatus Micrarchaeota archaeon]